MKSLPSLGARKWQWFNEASRRTLQGGLWCSSCSEHLHLKKASSEETKKLCKGYFRHLGMEKNNFGRDAWVSWEILEIWGKPGSAFFPPLTYLFHLKGLGEVHAQGHTSMWATRVCWSPFTFWTAWGKQCLWRWKETGNGFIFLKYFSDNIPTKNHSVGSNISSKTHFSKGHFQLQ